MKVAIIGGGPAGLATLRFLAKAHLFFPIPPIEVRLFEAEAEIGGTFVYRVYEEAELVSSKYLTAFSDFRFPEGAPDFVTPAAYVQYLRDYATFFDLWPHIHCHTRIGNIRRGPDGHGHIVTINRSHGPVEWACDAVAICTGINVNPVMPALPGINQVPIVLHSSQIKTRAQFGTDTNVVVLGAGETAMDLAHLAVTAPTKSVTLCHRDGFFCAPKIIPVPQLLNSAKKHGDIIPNKPVDTSVASLFDTAYAHPTLQRSQILWTCYDTWIKKMHWLISGTEEGPDQWVGQINPGRKYMDSIFLVKSQKAIPYMSVGHRSTSWANRLRGWLLNVPIKDIGNKRIDVRSWPRMIDQNGYMQFSATDAAYEKQPQQAGLKPDVVVFATGYTRAFSFLGKEYPDVSHTDVRGIYKEGDVSVGFIGFVRPSIGAIPPLAELQAQLWVLHLVQDRFPRYVPSSRSLEAVEPYELDYKLHPRQSYDFFNVKRGVDHESYAYQLAVDMGAAPTISHVTSLGWKVLFTWAMGSNFNPKFRMIGPWKWQDSEEVMRNELFNIVKQSGGVVYLLTYTIFPFLFFGLLSLMLYAWDAISGVFSVFEPSKKIPQIEEEYE